MSEKTPARPRQVVWGSAFAVSGSLFLLFTTFESLGRLTTVQLREQVTAALDESGVAVSVATALDLMRWGLSVTAIASAVAIVAAVFAFQRHRGARVALSVAAVPILLTSPITGVFLGVLVAMGASSLWSGQARDWFAGRPIRELPPPRRRQQTPPPPSQQPHPGPQVPAPVGASGLSGATPSSVPPAMQGYGDPRGPATGPATGPMTGPATDRMPDPAAPGGPWSPQQPSRRTPVPVRVACALTWAGSAVVAVAMLGTLAVYLLDPGQLRPALLEVEDQVRAQGAVVPPGLVTTVVWVSVLVFTTWAVAAAVLAELVRRRHDWARYLLAVSAVMAGLFSIFGGYAGLPVVVLCSLTVALLFRRETREWFAEPTHAHWPPYQPGPPQGPYPPQQ